MLLVGVLLEDGLEALLEAVDGGLASTEQGEARQLMNNKHQIGVMEEVLGGSELCRLLSPCVPVALTLL